MEDLYRKIKKELFMKIRLMDTTIKGITESQQYKENILYNQGIRDAIQILDRYKDILTGM